MQSSAVASPLTVQTPEAYAWDDYVGRHPQGHHEQTSGFAAMRVANGFKSVRVGVSCGNSGLVGGAQILIRHVPLVGNLALITQGPLVSHGYSGAAEMVVAAIDRLARKYHVVRLRVINYAADDVWSPHFHRLGFARGGYRWAARDTALVACDRDDSVILGDMKSKCRYNLRLAQRKGVSTRVGGEGDIETFYWLLQHTASRQGFPLFPLDYFRSTWRRFAPRGRLRLILAYADQEPLAGVMATVVGDRAYYGWGGLSPHRTNLMANYLTHWEAIRWARSVGCKFYDLSGTGDGDGVDRFKQQWGGQASVYPEPFEKYYGLLRGVRQHCTALAWENGRLRELVNRIARHQQGPMPY
ncbi:lipid II:glycine glycyltransferase FemX [Microbulbifer magnicolonia]|uniref:lipid II:glycine glycyltransferase FemX n=1 Tax=Microbulbifer magnicolonia TaxID=3109744 RepID=UPI002B4096AB|nr:peptidoglycan bridge formation glycyltransferase FemA/FemB family protein [Microbulbifer sp. GG15]